MRVGRRSFTTLFLTLVLVIAVPTAIMVVSFGATVRTMVRDDYISLSSQVVDNIRSTVDASMTARMNLAGALSTNLALKILVARVDETEEETTTACREIYNYNRALQVLGGMFPVSAVYIPDRDLVVSSTNIRMTGEEFYSRYVGLVGTDVFSFVEMVRSVQDHRYFSSTRSQTTYGSPRDLVLYVQAIDLGYLSHRAYFISSISTAALSELMVGGFEGGAHYRLLDGDGVQLAASAGIPWTWNGSAGPQPPHWSERASGGQYHAFFSSSAGSDLQYMFFVPEATVLRRLTVFQRVWLGVLAVCMVVGVLIARTIATRLHAPLQLLLEQAFPGGTRTSPRSVQEEYGLLADKMRETEIRDRQARQDLGAYHEALKTYALLRLLTQSGCLTAEELTTTAEACGLPLERMAYQAAVLSWDGPEDRATALCASLSGLRPDLTPMAARLTPNQLVVVVAVPREEGEPAALLPKLIASHVDAARGMRIGISRLHDDPRRLQRCLSEASAACISHARSAGAPYLSYGELIATAGTIYYPPEKELQIIAGVREGAAADVRRLLDEIRRRNLEERRLVPEMALCLYNDLIATAIKAYDRIRSEHPDLLEHSVSMLSMLNSNRRTTDQSFEEIQLLYEELCSASRAALGHKSRRTVGKVIDYMKANHSNPALCMDMVADHFGLSYYYLSHMLKDETHQSFTDTLNGIRVDRAIVLLRTSADSVQLICRRVGYTNWSTFLRAFRKRTGTTPLQLRKESYAEEGVAASCT